MRSHEYYALRRIKKNDRKNKKRSFANDYTNVMLHIVII